MPKIRSATLALLLGLAAAGCGAETNLPASAAATAQALTTNGVTATLSLQSDWGAGYCANVVLANGGTAPVTGWTLTAALNQSTVSSVWSATYTQSGGVITLTPLDWNASIAPGASVSFGFCGTATGTNYRPTLSTLSVTGGSSTPTSYGLTVNVAGPGTTSPAAGTYSYAAGTVVTLTATPGSGATFQGWSGDVTSSSATATVTMSANRTVTATFATSTPTSYTLTISTSGSGTTTPAAGTYTYPAGTNVSVTANAASGASFSGWSGAATGTANPVAVGMTANKALTATFTTSGPSTCDAGTTTTAWAASCPTAPPQSCVAGTWVDPGSTTGDPLVCQSAHFAVHSPTGTITAAQCTAATDELENVIWPTYFGAPIYFPEPYCSSSTKYKASIVIHSDYGLTGGGWGSGYMGMWVGPGATADHWGLAHEFMHAVQSTTRGLSCGGSSNYCGWIYESHANFMPHQLPEYASNVHCSEMLDNAPHLYLGSTRDRYCNWQFMEYLKDRYCYKAVNDIWTASTTSNDPFSNIMSTRGWSLSQLNDFLGEWAMHNVTWDYKVSGGAFRSTYGAITDKSRTERRLRLTQLDPLDLANRRFVSPYMWAPQRWGYNVVRLVPEAGATSVTVTFRGVVQSAATSDWRWGLVATDSALTRSRYSALQRGSDGQLTFCVNAGESLWLVVMGTPSTQQHINWDQAYPSIYRFPYMVQLQNAWPENFPGGAAAACPSGLVRIANGGGCGPSGLASSVYVGPYATVLGGSVSGSTRLEDHATVVSGTVTGGTIGGMTLVGSSGSPFNISPSAVARTTFYPLGFFESGQSLSGSATLYGDVEYRGQGYGRSSGICSGYVDSATCIPGNTNEVTVAPPYAWRP
jgi:hypothetical protein